MGTVGADVVCTIPYPRRARSREKEHLLGMLVGMVDICLADLLAVFVAQDGPVVRVVRSIPPADVLNLLAPSLVRAN